MDMGILVMRKGAVERQLVDGDGDVDGEEKGLLGG
jgi:hypothetical protein